MKKRITGISPGAMARSTAYDYPGNVRELRNIIERAIILAARPRDRASATSSSPSAASAKREPAAFFSVQPRRRRHARRPSRCVERSYVARVLEHFGGKRMAAAQTLGISYPTFLKRLRELGIAADDEPRRGGVTAHRRAWRSPSSPGWGRGPIRTRNERHATRRDALECEPWARSAA